MYTYDVRPTLLFFQPYCLESLKVDKPDMCIRHYLAWLLLLSVVHGERFYAVGHVLNFHYLQL